MADAVRYPLPSAVAGMPLVGHHVVEASAGTGKTFLIERRVVDLVIRGGAAIDRVLLVTFTEKATAELRRRVRQLVRELTHLREDRAHAGEPHWTIDDGARAALRAALFGFDQAAIHTIHGFCHRVLLDSAFDGRRPFRQTQVSTDAALHAALSDCLRDTLAVDEDAAALLEAHLARRGSVDGLANLMSELLRMRGSLAQPYDAALLDRELADLADALTRAGDGFAAAMRAAKIHGGTIKAAVARRDLLLELAGRRADEGLPALLDELAEAAGKLEEFLTRDGAAESPLLADLAARASALAAAAPPLQAAIAARFLPAVRERLERNKAERGQFDFNDMLEQVWRALEGPGGAALAARLRARYPHALIDEFQDTDELQWAIFRRLYLEAPAGSAHLTVVGDPKQAIYGFRGADLATFLAARAEMTAGRAKVELATSYRSSAPLVRALNRVFGDGDGDAPFFTGGIEYTPIVAARGGDEGAPPLCLYDLGGVTGPADARRSALAGTISAEIARLLASGTDAGSIFVLTRSTAESRELADRFRQDGVRCALFQQEGLFQTDEAAEVRDLLAAVAAPRDRSARLRAWQTRFFAVPLARLPELAELGDGHPLVARFGEWKALADRLDYERLFPRILADTRLVEREIALAPSERALTNFLHIFELLQEEMLAARCDVGELVRRVSRWIVDRDGSEEANVQRLESERDAVQIMTIHRAKGLEADVVFLYGGTGAPPPRQVRLYHAGEARRAHVGRVRDAAIARAVEAEERGENERLLYVALTRAADRLYVPCWQLPPDKEPGASVGELLNARLQGWLASRGEPGLVEVRPVLGAAPAPDEGRAAAVLAAWRPSAAGDEAPAVQRDRQLARALAERRGPVTTSYTRIKHAGLAAGAPVFDVDELDRDERAGATRGSVAAALPGGRRVGIFLHQVLEELPLATALADEDAAAWAARPDVDEVFRRAAGRHDVEDAGEEGVAWRRLVWQALRLPIDFGAGRLVPGVAAAARHLREVEFLFPLVGEGGAERAMVRGAIDLVFEHDGRVYWLDWKSDALPDFSADAVAAHVVAEYALQAELYSLALAKMLGITTAADHEARFGGLVYFFLRGGAVHVARPSFDDVRRHERALGAREVLG